MRKVNSIVFSLLLTLMLAIPAYAAIPSQKCAQNNSFWDWFKGLGITQSTVPSLSKESPSAAAPVSKDAAIKAPAQNDLTADENYILQQVNAERSKAGLAPLQIDSRLVQTARAKSQDMIDNGYF